MSHAKELLRAAEKIGVEARELSGETALDYVGQILSKYAPQVTHGHLSIGGDIDKYPLEALEFDYSVALPRAPVRIFFGRRSDDAGTVVEVKDGSQIGEILKECYGMEYFLSDARGNFLIAVNWYVIEVAGPPRRMLEKKFAGQKLAS